MEELPEWTGLPKHLHPYIQPRLQPVIVKSGSGLGHRGSTGVVGDSDVFQHSECSREWWIDLGALCLSPEQIPPFRPLSQEKTAEIFLEHLLMNDFHSVSSPAGCPSHTLALFNVNEKRRLTGLFTGQVRG